MKTLFTLTLAAALLTGCGSKNNPAPAPQSITDPNAPTVSYSDPAGNVLAVDVPKAYLVTAPPDVPDTPRHAVVVVLQLPDGTALSVSYYYTGGGFPNALGPVTLDAPVTVDHITAAAGATSRYQAPISAATVLSVDGSYLVSGSYTGPLVAGQGAVHLVFHRLPVAH